jgi:hypothetical protein
VVSMAILELLIIYVYSFVLKSSSSIAFSVVVGTYGHSSKFYSCIVFTIYLFTGIIVVHLRKDYTPLLATEPLTDVAGVTLEIDVDPILFWDKGPADDFFPVDLNYDYRIILG